MIEHLTSDGGSRPNNYDFMDKINELVDAIVHNMQAVINKKGVKLWQR